MATKRKTTSPNIKLRTFVGRIVKDPASPPDLRVLTGYIGQSSIKDHIRVYLDLALRRYIDVPQHEIVQVDESLTKSNPLAKTILWINAQTSITHGGHWAASEDPTTMATGEEGGGDPTTMATGEEEAIFLNPWEAVVNPLEGI